MESAYINASGREVVGRSAHQKDYYKVVNWENRLFYLVSHGRGEYDWIRCYDWGKVSNHFLSSDDPIGFIQNRVHALNRETSTGIKLIKQLKRLPFKVNFSY